MEEFALHLTPLIEYTGLCGNTFIAKKPPEEYDGNAAVYEDIPVASLKSPLLGMALEKLHTA